MQRWLDLCVEHCFGQTQILSTSMKSSEFFAQGCVLDKHRRLSGVIV